MQNIDIQTFEVEYDRQLQTYRPVEAVHQSRRIQEELGRDSFDTVFDHFIHDYVGHPTKSEHAPTLQREREDLGLVNYPNRMYFGFTDTSKLLLIRSTSDLVGDRPESLLIVTADLASEQVLEWNVTELSTRTSDGFECYMEDIEGNEAHLCLGTQAVRLAMPGARRPEGVRPLDKHFFDLLEKRNRFRHAEAVGNLLLFMAYPHARIEDPVTIAA